MNIDLASGMDLGGQSRLEEVAIIRSPGIEQRNDRLRVTQRQCKPLEAAEVAAPATRPAAVRTGTIRLDRVGVKDPGANNLTAATFLVPAGWNSAGEVLWRWHPAEPATIAFRAWDPGSAEHIQWYPTLRFVDGVREQHMQILAVGGLVDPATEAARVFPEGAIYHGDEIRRIVLDPARIVRELIIPRFRPDLEKAVIGATAESPVLAARVAAERTESDRNDFRVARVRVSYAMGFGAVEEDFHVAITTLHVPPGLVCWRVAAYSVRARRGDLDSQADLFEALAASPQIGLEWYNVHEQVAGIVQKTILEQIQTAGRISDIISQTNREISDMIQQGWERKNRVLDRVHEDVVRSIRGTEVYSDPFRQQPVELPSGYSSVWSNNRGEYLLSNDPALDPNAGSDVQWRRVERR